MSIKTDNILQKIAQYYGIQPVYLDSQNNKIVASSAVIFSLLQGLGAPIQSENDIVSHYQHIDQTWWKTIIEPVTIAWDGELKSILLRLPIKNYQTIPIHIRLENGNLQTSDLDMRCASIKSQKKLDQTNYAIYQVAINTKVPLGYHKLIVSIDQQTQESMLVAAPFYAYTNLSEKKSWGLFVPLYSLHSKRSLNAGDTTDLNQLIEWSAKKNANVIGTLPLFSLFLDKPCDPSPYSPISKLFFNEFYLDIQQIEEFKQHQVIRDLFHSKAIQDQIALLNNEEMINYQQEMSIKKQLLLKMANLFFKQGSKARHDEFNHFLTHHPELDRFATFRAVVDQIQLPWTKWPTRLKQGLIKPSDYDKEIKAYYLYVQWQINKQLKTVSQHAKQQQIHLYLDMPLGVHPGGFDTWNQQHLFAHDLTVGSPPDAVFKHGQNWGFPPQIPSQMRQTHYHYFIQSLRTLFPLISFLRLDHVMSLHRLYCIPSASDAKDGAYIRYPANELYAILCLESHRYSVCLVGENLGTVPKVVNQTMKQHHFLQMHITQYELESNHQLQQKDISRHSIASLNTHDMYPFTGYLKKEDLNNHFRLGILNNKQYQQALAQREKNIQYLIYTFLESKIPINDKVINQLITCLLIYLAKSQSALLIINTEDLWQETQPINIPTTKEQYPNWRRKYRYSFDSWKKNEAINDILKKINQLRHNGCERNDNKNHH